MKLVELVKAIRPDQDKNFIHKDFANFFADKMKLHFGDMTMNSCIDAVSTMLTYREGEVTLPVIFNAIRRQRLRIGLSISKQERINFFNADK